MTGADLKFMYDVRRALGMNDKCGLSGLAENVAEVRRIALRLREALEAQVKVNEQFMRRAEFSDQDVADCTAQARAAIADAQFPRLWDERHVSPPLGERTDGGAGE